MRFTKLTALLAHTIGNYWDAPLALSSQLAPARQLFHPLTPTAHPLPATPRHLLKYFGLVFDIG